MEKGSPQEEAEYLAHLYGSNVTELFEKIATTEPVMGLSLAETLALHYALDNEMVLTPADYLVRRTNHLLFMRDTLDEVKQGVISEMSHYYNWSENQVERYTNELNQLIAESDLSILKEGKK